MNYKSLRIAVGSRLIQLPLSLLIALAAWSGQRESIAGEKLTREETQYFESKVRPLLVKHCQACHSTETEGGPKGGLLLDSAPGWQAGGDSGEAIEPGRPSGSLLIKVIQHSGNELQMPPKYKMADSEIEVLTEWVRRGAPDPRKDAKAVKRAPINIADGRQFWAYQPLHEGKPPRTTNEGWVKNDIDRYILAGLQAKGMTPSKDADRTTLIRRLTFDLIGLPPSAEDIRAFVEDRETDDVAIKKAVDRLLESPHFGERWGRHWLDVARYADSTGRTRNIAFAQAWRYRNYVIESFNQDKPFNVFLTEQIAGDLLSATSAQQHNEQLIATGFLAIGSTDLNERSHEQFVMDQIDDQLDVIGRAFLGLTIGCARCHDHKFDPIPQTDYYALAGIFRSSETMSGQLPRAGAGRDYVAPHRLNKLADLEEAWPPKKAAEEKDVSKAEDVDKKDRKTLRRDLNQVAGKLRALLPKNSDVKQNSNDEERAFAKLAKRNKDAEVLYDEYRRLRRAVAEERNGKGGEQALNAPSLEQAAVGPYAMGVAEGKIGNSPTYLRGEIDKKGETVPRGFLQVIPASHALAIPKESSGRKELAAWLTAAENPLTPRVMTNRIWQHLFGRGIVASVDNFGTSGEKPTHPELLDDLARRFQSEGWSVKKIVRLIVLSHTYRQSSAENAKNLESDPENQYLWRSSIRRIEAESLRDAILAVSGKLNMTPPQRSPLPSPNGEVNVKLDKKRGMTATTDSGDLTRSVYLPLVRSRLQPVFETFDFPDPSEPNGHRDVTTVAPQALYLLNNPFVVDNARFAAERLLNENSGDEASRIRQAFLMTVGRAPAEAEIAAASKYMASCRTNANTKSDKETWSLLIQSLYGCIEFRYLF